MSGKIILSLCEFFRFFVTLQVFVPDDAPSLIDRSTDEDGAAPALPSVIPDEEAISAFDEELRNDFNAALTQERLFGGSIHDEESSCSNEGMRIRDQQGGGAGGFPHGRGAHRPKAPYARDDDVSPPTTRERAPVGFGVLNAGAQPAPGRPSPSDDDAAAGIVRQNANRSFARHDIISGAPMGGSSPKRTGDHMFLPGAAATSPPNFRVNDRNVVRAIYSPQRKP